MSDKFKFTLSILVLLVVFLSIGIFRESKDKWAEYEGAKLPIVYSDNYDITLFSLQNLHPFDSQKYSRVQRYLTEHLHIKKRNFHAPEKATDEMLLVVHSKEYLDSLNRSRNVARISELGAIRFVPGFVLRERLLDPIRYGVGGTVLASELAMKEGWAINLAGGYHHAKREEGGGFCFYADVPIAVELLWKKQPELKVLVVDLDAHQGNGIEAAFADDPRVAIVDVYRQFNYPDDDDAKKYIDYDYPLGPATDDEFMAAVDEAVPKAIVEFGPELIVYNAGTDVLASDPLGGMNMSSEVVTRRDEVVFRYALESGTPIVMVLSGGYGPESAEAIGASLVNLLANVIDKKP